MLQAERSAAGRSSKVAWLALSACLLTPALSRAEEPAWLHWSAPVECQNTAEVERRVQFLLGKPLDFAFVPPTRVRMGWSAKRGWSVRVTVQLAAGPRNRALDAPSCGDAFDVIALSLALILDPDFQAAEEAQLDVANVEATSVSQKVVLEEVEAEPNSSRQPDVPKASGAGLELVPGSDTLDVDDGLDETTDSTVATLAVGGAALTDIFTFPVPQFGGGVQLALGLGAARIELEADMLASRRTTFSDAQYPLSFSSVFGAARGCYGVAVTPRLDWVGCAGGEVGSIGTRELGGDERRAHGLWLAAQVLGGPEFAATDWLDAFVRFRAVAPLVRHEFLLSEGSRVHELPWVSLQLQVGIALHVTEFGGAEH